ncbi:MAG: RNA-guided endonuclease InsQ/TnpB family protein [Janthinobacterium lividum]
MKQVIVIKLEPSQKQYQALLKTVEAFNRGCQYAADVAYEKRLANKIALQPFIYGTLRSEFGLSSQMAIRAIAKAVEAYKRDKRIHVKFDVHGGMVYDPRIMSFKGLTQVSLLCLSGRELIPMRYGAYQSARLDYAKGQADLMLRDGMFYLYVTADLPSAPPVDVQDVLGVDLGIVQLAVDSDGEAHTGAGVKQCRRRFQRLRQGLQSCGSKSAKRHLKRIRQKESRYQRWVNHNISRHLVQKALVGQKALSLEDLHGIRERVTVRKTHRYERLSWDFHQLRSFIAYKAEVAGVPLHIIDPRNTSRTCLACGHCAKENRRRQSEFLCEKCGFQANADFVGSQNIRRKGLEARATLSGPLSATA